MSEDTEPQADQPRRDEQTGLQREGEQARGGAGELSTELREMGQQLEATFRAALESERAQQLQRDIAGGIRELSYQIQAAMRSLQANPRFQQAGERGRQAIAQARESKLAHDVEDTIVSGMAQLNDQLRKLVDRLESDRAGQASPTTQQVPIEHEPPATGETTRLEDQDKAGP
jgi:hypothetical protein